jgi:hypothetical protein
MMVRVGMGGIVPVGLERTVPLKDNPNLSIYFKELIEKASQDGMARAATFSDINPNESFDLCMRMFRNLSAFTNGSKVLGEKFYQLMQADQRIGDGDLVICRFAGDSDDPDLGRDFLAIMKLLPIGAYRNVQKGKTGTGGMYIELEVDPFIFPRDSNVLQKVAFVSKPPSRGGVPDVLILDKQYKRGEIAQFFKNFLDVALVRDSAELTLSLYRCLIHSLNDMRQTLTPALDRYLGDVIYEIFSEKGITKLTNKGVLDIYDWVDGLKASQNVKNWIRKDLQIEFLVMKKIKIDLKLVEKYIKRRSFFGQVGSKFYVETTSYNDLVKSVSYVTNKPGVQPFYEVIIHTTTWREEV